MLYVSLMDRRVRGEKKNWQILVLVTEADYARLKAEAGEVPLSAYCRNILVGKREGKKSRFSSLPVVGE